MVSVGLHVSLLCGAILLYQWGTRLNPVTIQMGPIGDPTAAESDKAPGLGQPKPAPEPPKPEPSKPEPPKPEPKKPEPPKPEPPKPEPPKPEPPKPEPPKPEPSKPEPPKPEPPKPEPKKPEKKPEPVKPEKKPEPAKPEKKTEPSKKASDKTTTDPSAKKDPKAKPGDSKTKTAAAPTKTAPGKPGSPDGLPSQSGPAKPGVRNEGMPSFLDGWCRNLQRKVESVWTMPEGMLLPNNRLAEVEFWVDRAGNVMDTPRVVKEADDPALGQSGVRAIMMAAPFPPLPDAFDRNSLAIVYVFGVE